MSSELAKEIREAVRVAMELCYKEVVIEKIENAKCSGDIARALKFGRDNM